MGEQAAVTRLLHSPLQGRFKGASTAISNPMITVHGRWLPPTRATLAVRPGFRGIPENRNNTLLQRLRTFEIQPALRRF
jgi:hypothetical protein